MSSRGGEPLRVLVTDAADPASLAPLRSIPGFQLIERPGIRGDDLRRALQEVDAVVARTATALGREVLGGPGRLKAIARPAVGVDNIDIAAATEFGIAVLNAPRGNTLSAAEHTLALLLALARDVPAADRSIRRGDWDRSHRGLELAGRTLGVLGLGRIGRAVAARASGFGMRVVGFDPLLADARAIELGVEPAPLLEVVARADVLTLHVPLSAATRRLIDRDRIAAMKPGALLINAARGGVVDEAALLEALDAGHLAGAALDVFECEPLAADHPLRRRPDVVLTPHLGAATTAAQERLGHEIADAMVRALLRDDIAVALNAPYLVQRLGPFGELIRAATRAAREAADAAALPIAGVDVLSDAEGELLRAVTSAAAAGVLESVLGPGSSSLADATEILADRGIPLRSRGSGQKPDAQAYSVEVRLEPRAGAAPTPQE